MRDVAIVGVGQTSFGVHEQRSLCELASDAALRAIDDAGAERIDAVWIASTHGAATNVQRQLGALLAGRLALGAAPAFHVEAADASGAAAFRAAWLEVASGAAETALAVGVDKFTNLSDAARRDVLQGCVDHELEAYAGVDAMASFGMLAREYMRRYDAPREALSAVVCKNRLHGVHNPLATRRQRVSRRDVEHAPCVADPLRTLDCAELVDGAAAIVVASVEWARRLSLKRWTRVAGVGAGSAPAALQERPDVLAAAATHAAAARAFHMAELTPNDVQVVEVHDVCSFAELWALDQLGLTATGAAAAETLAGVTSMDGALPVNPSGGMLSCGAPLAAVGLAQLVHLAQQLRGEAGPMQVAGARAALAHCMGGVDTTAVVTLLTAPDEEPTS